MFKKILTALFIILGGALGFFLGRAVLQLQLVQNIHIGYGTIAGYVIIAILTFILAWLFYMLSPFLIRHTVRLVDSIEKAFSKIPPGDMILGAVGGLIALSIFFIITNRLFDKLDYIGPILGIIGNVIAFFLGANILVKKRSDVENFFLNITKGKIALGSKVKSSDVHVAPKILDTSVIIDGRILDIVKSGFLEGTIIIPSFVLEELRHIADSSDSLKRNRGRRGLDILNSIQKEDNIQVKIWEKDVKEAKEVDVKLLFLARQLGGKVLTNDYNLNKVAELQGVNVLNINELANAVKPILLPGEEINILISKVGKEQNQGIAYLDDGTMVVVENGKKLVNQEVDLIVTTVLQTAAGRMIFARPKGEA